MRSSPQKTGRSSQRPAIGSGIPTVTVCRGCCCGSGKTSAGVDKADVALLREQLAGRARVRVSDCLGPCEQSDVVVVVPSAEGRRAGGRPTWLGLVMDGEILEDIGAWVADGGPGIADCPAVLGLHEFRPSTAGPGKTSRG